MARKCHGTAQPTTIHVSEVSALTAEIEIMKIRAADGNGKVNQQSIANRQDERTDGNKLEELEHSWNTQLNAATNPGARPAVMRVSECDGNGSRR